MTPKAPHGLKAVFSHYRYENEFGQILPCGGETVCQLQRVETGVIVVLGVATCSQYDTYSKKLGRDISLGRAVCALTGEAQLRRERRVAREVAGHLATALQHAQ